MDFNHSGKFDLIAGDTEGHVWFFKNIGTRTEPKLAAGVLLESDGRPIVGTAPDYQKGKDGQYHVIPNPKADMGIYSKLQVVDYDGDGLLDLLVGQESPKDGESEIVFYKNIGTAEAPKFAAPRKIPLPKELAMRPAPCAVDWDGDGKLDLLVSTETSDVYFLRNTGTTANPVYAKPEKIALPGIDKCYRCRITVVDWNNDGKLDLLVGTFYSGREADKKTGAEGMGGNVWLFLRK